MTESKGNTLEHFKSLHQKYLTGQYVFKKCIDARSKNTSRKWLVVLQKTDKTITNESRKNVFDPKYAKFRGNQFRVIKIINVNNPKLIKNKILNVFEDTSGYNYKLEYKVGEIVKVNNYDMNPEEVCSSGIHYFNSIEPAYFYNEIPKKFSGACYIWYPNGQKHIECECVNGVLNGKYIEWYDNGQKHREFEYTYGVLNGKYIKWYDNGLKIIECEYVDGVKLS